MHKNKIIAILVTLSIVSGAAYLIYAEGNDENVISTPTIPQSHSSNTTPVVKPNTDTQKEDKGQTDADSKKAELDKNKKDEEEIKDTYNKTPSYSDNQSISSYTYTANSVSDLEDKLLDHINTVNSNTLSKVESSINQSNTQTSNKLSSIQQAIDSSKVKAEEALKKAEEALKKADTSVNNSTTSSNTSKTTVATLTGTSISGTYTGTIVSGAPTDNGTFVRNDTNKNILWTYTGTFANGTMATGVMTYKDGTVLKGSFISGMLNGDAEITTDNFTYKGTVSAGKITGKGVLSYVTGETYTGSLLDGKYDGYGTYVDSNLNTIKGNFKSGNLIERVS